MLHIVFHPKYLEYNFGPNHPFRPQRAQEFLKRIKHTDLEYSLHEPKRADDEDILLVHPEKYLDRVKRLAKTRGALSADTPVNPQVLEAAYYYTGGTILVSQLALENRRAFNLLGGLHHAGISDSSGFCIFNDHAIAIRKLKKQDAIKKAFVFDVDVHAGQGTQEIFYQDPSVFTFSVHQDPRTLYPGTGFPDQTGEGEGKGFNRNIVLKPGSGEDSFMQAASYGLELLQEFKPDLTILILGADTFKEDPLANIKLEISTYRKLGDKFKSINNLAVLCAGGYSRKVPDIWIAFLEGFLQLNLIENKSRV